ncbi:MAG: oxidoreductase [Chloroflexota bacterium]
MNWTSDNIPSQQGRTIIVTGASGGLGRSTTIELARKQAKIIMAVRNVDKGEQVADEIRSQQPDADIHVMKLELSSLDAIKTFAEAFRAENNQLDLLINNAGIYDNKGRKTEDGFALVMGVNHLGHFALTGHLIDLLLATPSSRVVTVSSSALRSAQLDLETFHAGPNDTYGASKLANALFASELHRRLGTLDTNTISVTSLPGASKTDSVEKLIQSQNVVLRRILDSLSDTIMQKPNMGALPNLRAATDPQAQGGQFYGVTGFGGFRGYPDVVQPSKKSEDVDMASGLWERSVELTGVNFVALDGTK